MSWPGTSVSARQRTGDLLPGVESAPVEPGRRSWSLRLPAGLARRERSTTGRGTLDPSLPARSAASIHGEGRVGSGRATVGHHRPQEERLSRAGSWPRSAAAQRRRAAWVKPSRASRGSGCRRWWVGRVGTGRGPAWGHHRPRLARTRREPLAAIALAATADAVTKAVDAAGLSAAPLDLRAGVDRLAGRFVLAAIGPRAGDHDQAVAARRRRPRSPGRAEGGCRPVLAPAWRSFLRCDREFPCAPIRSFTLAFGAAATPVSCLSFGDAISPALVARHHRQPASTPRGMARQAWPKRLPARAALPRRAG